MDPIRLVGAAEHINSDYHCTAVRGAMNSDRTYNQTRPCEVCRIIGASKAFYAALAVLDNGEAMEKVWAHTPYPTWTVPQKK